MVDILNIIAAVLSIALGAFGFLAPRYTAGVLDLKTGDTTMGLSELRASAGGMFMAVGAACLWLSEPWAYAMLGFVYLGAGAGRALSLVLDKPPYPKAHLYFLFEAVFAAWLILANL
ncbi:DUF4345 family protein [Marivita hallyeonensis]|uniref:DUF4345 domain-containing protein n=1 Tax=Marivita hallyeonensis TaxID=996342 RepID=A0A1M5VYA8_9RHOB|nr:DUF4345 family protein [Marivita hallyeonensis]SHH80178.1 protein of unknown function [Marivita hallyeonensis]